MTTTMPPLGSDPAALEPWIPILERVLDDEQNGMLIRLRRDSEKDVELGLLPLDGVHPAELLDGFDAPPDWLALGLVCRGWASPMDEGRPSRHPQRRRVMSVVLADRAGNLVGRTTGEDGTVLIDGPPTEGHLLELLRAVLAVDEDVAVSGECGHDGR
jgi:hypothetical protein